MTTHISKTGRLPKSIRHQLGLRLEDGQPGADLVLWLNSLPEVHAALKQYFAGRPISEQNLSDWKQSGHLDWLRREEARQAALHFAEQADDLEAATPDRRLSDRFATVLAAELARLAMALLEQETDPEKKWQRLCQIHQQLSRMRKDDDRAAQTALQRQQREQEREDREEEQRQQQAHKQRLMDMVMSPLHNQAMAQAFGGGEYGQAMAQVAHNLRFDLPMKDVEDLVALTPPPHLPAQRKHQ